MNTIKSILLTLALGAVATLSFLLFQKSRKVEDLYDDLLDAKAQNTINLSTLKLQQAKENYVQKLQNFHDVMQKHGGDVVVFTLDQSSSSTGDESGASQLPKIDPTKLN